MDGNRRWAKNHFIPSYKGHKAGYENIKVLVKHLSEHHNYIKYVTIYAFSSENMTLRPLREKTELFKLFANAFKILATDKHIHANEVKINFLGRWYLLPPRVKSAINKVIKVTKQYNALHLNICLVYDGHDELVDAMREIAGKQLNPSEITRETIKEHLWSRDSPPLDLIIRTGMKNGCRTSGFMLWDSSYSEFAFTHTHFPSFTPEELDTIIENFHKTERRFGG
jgi:undecaprenyl diphosphate synthase